MNKKKLISFFISLIFVVFSGDPKPLFAEKINDQIKINDVKNYRLIKKLKPLNVNKIKLFDENKPLSSSSNQVSLPSSTNLNKVSLTNIKEPSQVILNKTKNTIGHYVILDYINSEISYDEFWILNKSDFDNFPNIPNYGYTGVKSPTKNKNSFGFRYAYAMNYRDIFLMPEFFYNYIDIKAKFEQNLTNEISNPLGQFYDWSDENGYGFKNLKIHDMMGLKLNLGYDLNSYFSVYGLIGYAKLKISNTSGIYDPYTSSVKQKINQDLNPRFSKNKIEPFYGFGLKLKLNKNLNLFSEYQRFDIKVQTGTKNFHNMKFLENGSFINAKLVVTKIGLGYNF